MKVKNASPLQPNTDTPGNVCVVVVTSGDDSTLPENVENTTIRRSSGAKTMSIKPNSLLRWSVMVDCFIFLLALMILMISTQSADDKYSITSNEEFRFPLILTTVVIQLVVLTLLTIFICYNRKEPEIESQNSYFIIQILVCSGISFIGKSLAFLMQYGCIHSNLYAKVIVIAIGVQAYYGVISAILLRLRTIYMICVKQVFRPSYFTGLSYHIPVIIISVVPLYVCAFTSITCSAGAQWSGSWVMWTFFTSEFAFYLWNVRPLPGLFVDFGSNIRVFCFILMAYIGTMTYCIAEGRPVVVYDLSFILFPFTLYIAWFEIFGLVAIKILGRRCGTQWLRDADLQGVAGTFFKTKGQTMDFVLSDAFVLEKFKDLARERQCEEALEALIGVRSIQIEFELGNLATVGILIKQWVAKHVTGEDTAHRVNISSENREDILEIVESLNASIPFLTASMRTISDIDQHLRSLLRTHMIALLKTEAVVEHCLTLLALARVGFLSAEGVGTASTSLESNSNRVSERKKSAANLTPPLDCTITC